MAVAPTLLVVDTLAAAVRAAFAVRGLGAVEVLIGEWEDEKHRGTERVILGLGDFELGEPGGHAQPGVVWQLDDGTEARAIGEDVEAYPVWCHGVAPADTAPDQVPIVARARTKMLVHETWAAIRKAHGGLLRSRSKGRWLNEARGPFVYGGLASFAVTLADPILDDPFEVGTADELQVSCSFAGMQPAETVDYA